MKNKAYSIFPLSTLEGFIFSRWLHMTGGSYSSTYPNRPSLKSRSQAKDGTVSFSPFPMKGFFGDGDVKVMFTPSPKMPLFENLCVFALGIRLSYHHGGFSTYPPEIRPATKPVFLRGGLFGCRRTSHHTHINKFLGETLDLWWNLPPHPSTAANGAKSSDSSVSFHAKGSFYPKKTYQKAPWIKNLRTEKKKKIEFPKLSLPRKQDFFCFNPVFSFIVLALIFHHLTFRRVSRSNLLRSSSRREPSITEDVSHGGWF